MAKRIAIPLLLTLLVVAFALAILKYGGFGDLVLPESGLRLNHTPVPPAQPIKASLACSGGLVVESGNHRRLVLINDHPPCTVGLDSTNDLETTAAEMLVLRRRPQVTFKVDEAGGVMSAKIVGSSGSRTLDDKAIKLIFAHNFPRHNCGVCRVSTQVNISFKGPVWVKE